MDASHVVYSDGDDADSILHTSLVYKPGNSNVQTIVWSLPPQANKCRRPQYRTLLLRPLPLLN
jgi:hypothetical protein